MSESTSAAERPSAEALPRRYERAIASRLPAAGAVRAPLSFISDRGVFVSGSIFSTPERPRLLRSAARPRELRGVAAAAAPSRLSKNGRTSRLPALRAAPAVAGATSAPPARTNDTKTAGRIPNTPTPLVSERWAPY